MAIETVKLYYPKMKHLVYARLAFPERNDYTVFNEYEIRVPDTDNGGDGPYNYIHEAFLIAKQRTTWAELPGLVTGYIANTRDAQEAMERIHPLGEDGSFDDDTELVLLVFMRKDQTKKYILSGDETMIPHNAEINELEEYTDNT